MTFMELLLKINQLAIQNPEQAGFLLGFLLSITYGFAGIRTEKLIRGCSMFVFLILLGLALVFAVQYQGGNYSGAGWSAWSSYWTLLPGLWVGNWIFKDYILKQLFPDEVKRRRLDEEETKSA